MQRLILALICLLAACSAVMAQSVNLRRTPAVEVFEHNRDAVVNINTTTVIRQRFGPWGNDPLFERFFGRSYERDVTRRSLGSGFILHPDGYIVTNAHVVQSADQVQVNLADGATLDAAVLAADADHDLAILKIEPPADQPLQAVTLGDSGDLMPGEPVIAIGNPLGYHHSVSAGIISATGRGLPIRRNVELQDLIQTDTSINPGNSGGPLLNAYGQVIGINTAIRGDAQNIGFAIPVNQLRDLLGDLLSPLALRRVDLGGRLIEHRAVTPPASLHVELQWIDRNQPDEPFRVATIGGEPVADIVQATVAMLQVEAGEQVLLADESGRTRQLHARAPRVTDAQRLARAVLGLTPRPITPADRARLQLGDARGLVIESVDPGGPAATAGLQRDDVLVQVGRHPIQSLDDLAALLTHAVDGAPADVFVIRRERMGRTRLILRGPA